ncbi:MAG: molybdopterin dinucleotide binding domain-containing protein [Candidatus Freyarchaeota archaeon]
MEGEKMSGKLEMTLITCRTVEQGAAREGEKMGYKYMRACGKCYMDYEDMKALGLLPGDTVRLRTRHGEVVLSVERSPDAPHRGVVFVPLGPWANQIVDPETDSTGMPSLKAIPVTVEPAPEERVPDIKALISGLQK